MFVTDAAFQGLLDTRVHEPARVGAALQQRARRPCLAPDGALFIVAADHTARGALGVGHDPMAMADRRRLLERLATALANPRVDGVLGSADVLEDLALLGLLEGKVAIGTMNRGGLVGATWEIDDRMTAYDADHVARANLDGGKVLLRIDDTDPATAKTLEACGRAVSELADRGLAAMIEPIPVQRTPDGRLVVDGSPAARVRAALVAAGLGATSAYTWLKIQAGPGVHDVLSATTCPALILGGPPGDDPAATLASWREAMAHPHCRGLVVGRTVLYPHDGDVAGAIAQAADLVSAKAAGR